MSQSLNRFCNELRSKASAIAKNQMQMLSEAYAKISEKFETPEQRLKRELSPYIEQALSDDFNSQDELDLKKFIVAAWCSSDSEEKSNISVDQLTAIVDLLIHEVKSARKLEDGEITPTKVMSEIENKVIVILKKIAEIAFKTVVKNAVEKGVSLAVVAAISYLIGSPEQHSIILSLCIIPMIKTKVNDEANSLINAGISKFRNLFA